MINKKLLEKAKKLWIEIDIETLSKKLPTEVINDILETEIDNKLWKSVYYDYEEVRKEFDKQFNSQTVECIN